MGFSCVPPSKVSGLIGNPTAFSSAKEWAALWASGKPQKPLLVCGPTGTGKTALAHALAAEMGWELFEFNASDLRNEESISATLAHTSSSNSLFGGLRLILIDDADSLSGSADRGGASAMAKVLSSPRQPIILTASDPYSKKLSTMRALCTVIELRRPYAATIANLLKKIAEKEGIKLPQGEIGKIAEASNGDVRAALCDLFAGNTTASRDREAKIFEVLRTIFSSGKYSEARAAAFSSETDHDMLKLWVAQNIPLAYSSPFEISEAYSALSRADVFDGRIRRSQYWGYLRYSGDFLSSGVALAKTSPVKSFIPFSYPETVRKMGANRPARLLREGICRKISSICHCSMQQAASYIPLLREHARKGAEEIFSSFGFDEDEHAFVSGTAAKGKAKSAAGAARKKAKSE